MPSTPRHPAHAGEVGDDATLYREKFRRRLPESLDELQGPAQGVVDLPLHMAWSGMASYDLGRARQRMGLYRTVLHEGLRDDLPQYLNLGLLLQLWPVLRTLVMALSMTQRFWHRSWGVVAECYLDVRLQETGSRETAYALSSDGRKRRSLRCLPIAALISCGR